MSIVLRAEDVLARIEDDGESPYVYLRRADLVVLREVIRTFTEDWIPRSTATKCAAEEYYRGVLAGTASPEDLVLEPVAAQGGSRE